MNRDGRWLRQCASSIALLVVVSSGTGCGEKPVEEKPVVQPVKMLTIAASDARAEREYPGTVSAAQRADMAFEVPGRIIEFPVDEGQKVAEGAVLARLDGRDYQARLDSAKAVLRKAQADYQRSQNLYREDPGAIALTTLDSDRRGVDVAEAQSREAEKALEDAVLRAPFAGVVGRKLVEDFANVQAKQPVLILQDTSHLEIVVSVPERDFVAGPPSRNLQQATQALQPRVQIPSLPDHAFAARFKEVAATADPKTRTFAATLIFDNPDALTILPGMTAKVVVRAAERQRRRHRGSGQRHPGRRERQGVRVDRGARLDDREAARRRARTDRPRCRGGEERAGGRRYHRRLGNRRAARRHDRPALREIERA